MKTVLVLFLSAALCAPAAAQGAKKNAAPARPSPISESYAALPASERIAIQSDLVWTGDYNGIANGEFAERAIAAVKAFQKRGGGKETGVLNPQERAALAAAAKAKSAAAGWRLVDEGVGQTRIGVPTKLMPQTAATKSGTRWSSARGEAQVETFRLVNTAGLAAVLEQQQKERPERKIDYRVMRPDFFVVSGLLGLKKFYTRAHLRDGEVRGFTVQYDQAMEGIVDPIVVAMSSTFVAFPAATAAAQAPRKVDYGTGIVVSAAGDVLTERQITEGCTLITIAGLGGADRVADDKVADLALLRVYGAQALSPLELAAEGTAGADVLLTGVADPQAQGGGSAVSVQRARMVAAATGATLDPAPAPGFSGAAAVDAQGRLVGVTRLAGPGPAVLIPTAVVRQFLAAHGVTAAGSAPADAKKAVVRVICVRK